MFLKVFQRVSEALSSKGEGVEHPKMGVRILEASKPAELRDLKFISAVQELQSLPHHNYSFYNRKTGRQEVVSDRMAEIIRKKPILLNNPQVQKLILDTINFYHHWKDHQSVLSLLSKIEPIITPDLLNKCSSETLRFIGTLRVEYLTSVDKTVKILKKAFKDDLHVVIGYNGKLPPGLQSRLNTIRKLTRQFESSEFGKYEEAMIKELKDIKRDWNRAVMPRLKNIKKFRRDFKKSTGRYYGQKNPTTEAKLQSV